MRQTNREGQSLLLHAMGCRAGLGFSLQWDMLTSAPSSKHLSWGSCTPLWPQEAEQATSLSTDHRYSAKKHGRDMLTLKTCQQETLRKERVRDVFQDEILGLGVSCEGKLPTPTRHQEWTKKEHDSSWCKPLTILGVTNPIFWCLEASGMQSEWQSRAVKWSQMWVLKDISSIFLKGCDLVKMWLTAVASSIYDCMIIQQCVSYWADDTDHQSWRWIGEFQHT